jgi:hypothetical protein
MFRILFVVVALLSAVQTFFGEEPKELLAAKTAFAQTSHPDEAQRVAYILQLAALREKLARANGDWKAVDAEIMAHPAPAGGDSAALSKLRVGAWKSPRHDYLFRNDGTWTMTPADPGTTHGTWKIEGNRYEEGLIADGYTIILLTAKDFIFTDGAVIFYETRKGK